MKFTKTEKILLLQEIKKRPILWNKKSKDHNTQLVKKSWNQISQILLKSELDCKKCFQSLRNCQRYQRNKQQQQLQQRQIQQSFPNKYTTNDLKSKYPGEKLEIGGGRLNEWEMDQYLSFLPEKHFMKSLSLPIAKNSSAPKPIQLFKCQDSAVINNIDDGGGIDFENNNGFVYSYVTPSDMDPCDDIASSSLVNDVWNTSVEDQFQTQELLKYDGMLKNIDWLLQKLPETDVIDLNMQFIKLIYDKLQQNDEGAIKIETIC